MRAAMLRRIDKALRRELADGLAILVLLLFRDIGKIIKWQGRIYREFYPEEFEENKKGKAILALPGRD